MTSSGEAVAPPGLGVLALTVLFAVTVAVPEEEGDDERPRRCCCCSWKKMWVRGAGGKEGDDEQRGHARTTALLLLRVPRLASCLDRADCASARIMLSRSLGCCAGGGCCDDDDDWTGF
jgi:hypothetical protein